MEKVPARMEELRCAVTPVYGIGYRAESFYKASCDEAERLSEHITAGLLGRLGDGRTGHKAGTGLVRDFLGAGIHRAAHTDAVLLGDGVQGFSFLQAEFLGQFVVGGPPIGLGSDQHAMFILLESHSYYLIIYCEKDACRVKTLPEFPDQ